MRAGRCLGCGNAVYARARSQVGLCMYHDDNLAPIARQAPVVRRSDARRLQQQRQRSSLQTMAAAAMVARRAAARVAAWGARSRMLAVRATAMALELDRGRLRFSVRAAGASTAAGSSGMGGNASGGALTGCGKAAPLATAGAQEIFVDGAARPYMLAPPTSYQPSRAYPVVFVFPWPRRRRCGDSPVLQPRSAWRCGQLSLRVPQRLPSQEGIGWAWRATP
jgi:hypothetical protein